jgi:hypothetical protein
VRNEKEKSALKERIAIEGSCQRSTSFPSKFGGGRESRSLQVKCNKCKF